ncbi:MAG: hypothetical protein WCJ51_03995 [Candidatus Moraniibacteriota bacterium]
MIKRTVVIKRKACQWQPEKNRKIKTKITQPKQKVAGFVSPVLVVFICAVFSGVFYVYSINQTATQGIAIGKLEKEIAQKRNENDILRIREAQVKSLYHIEDQSKNLNMAPARNVIYLEETPMMAYSNAQAKNKN